MLERYSARIVITGSSQNKKKHISRSKKVLFGEPFFVYICFMNILLTGSEGFLGKKIYALLKDKYSITGIDLVGDNDVDITDQSEVEDFFNDNDIDLIVHTAAYADVDGCEERRHLALGINTLGTINLLNSGKKMIFISTDFVFDGEKGYYAEEDTPNPVSWYGMTKFMAEQAVMGVSQDNVVIRPSVLYGYNGEGDKLTFPNWVIRELGNDSQIPIVEDQIVTPTLIDDIAMAIDRIIEKDFSGILHVAGKDAVTRLHFAEVIKEEFELGGSFAIFNSDQLAQKANRPKNSSLMTGKLRNELGIVGNGVHSGLKELKKQMGS